jgi:hypothetical protein
MINFPSTNIYPSFLPSAASIGVNNPIEYSPKSASFGAISVELSSKNSAEKEILKYERIINNKNTKKIIN